MEFIPMGCDVRVAYLVTGAAGMYCGSCLRDNRLAATLIELGHDVVMLPLYTPVRTDERDVSESRVHYGGINVYLQQRSFLFRRLPAFVSRLLDAPPVLTLLSRWSGALDPHALGALTVSMLKGKEGAQALELERLVAALTDLRPDIVHLPSLPVLGLAGEIKDRLNTPIVCTLSGEDIFLDELTQPHRAEAFRLIRLHAASVDAFVATSRYYARHCIEHFSLPPKRVHTVPLGIRVEDFSRAGLPTGSPFTIGYLARVSPEKGLSQLAEAFVLLRRAGRDCRLRVAGYQPPSQQAYLQGVREYLRQPASFGAVDFLGEVTREQKVNFLRSLHVLCVPTIYREAKGLYVLEANASGVPVVQPCHGSFTELIEATGGGLLYDPAGGPAALAEGLARLMDDPALREELGRRGRAGVQEKFSDRIMATQTWLLYEQVLGASLLK